MFKLPITHLMLSNCSDAAFLVTPLRAANGTKMGTLYQIEAINTQGEVVLRMEGADKQLEGPQGHWHKLEKLAWALGPDQQPKLALGAEQVRGANDNG